MEKCIFCNIAAGKTNTEIVYADDKIAVFPDINPKAKTHLLFVPKQHIENLFEVDDSHAEVIFHLTKMLPKVANDLGLSGFRTVINTGRSGGQMVDHIHFHLLGGSTLPSI